MTDTTRALWFDVLAVFVTVVYILPIAMLSTPVVLIRDSEGYSFPTWAWVLAAIGYPLNLTLFGFLAYGALTSVS